MFKSNKGKSVKEKLKLLKKFALGESVIEDIIEEITPKITGFQFVMVKSYDEQHLTDEEFDELDAIPDHLERYKRYKEIRWHEEKTYADPEITNVHYSSPDAIVDDFKPIVGSEHSDITESTENIETEETPKNGLKTIHRRLYLEGISEQMKQDKTRREKMNQWTMMNGSLRPF